ncbi:MAG: 50S ribosomal protein L33 [Deltaproteobacteria bacterium]|nr:50S ribosomal protein L33 [Deltaproteobacteria bacterium]MBI3016686.1 50S ribosomal protein L33 [Deltaproteobacteria bacterium]
MERLIILLSCEKCKRKNYSTTKTKQAGVEKLHLKKYCPACRAHTVHKETKA